MIRILKLTPHHCIQATRVAARRSIAELFSASSNNREDGFSALIGLLERDKALSDCALHGIGLKSYRRFHCRQRKCTEISTTHKVKMHRSSTRMHSRARRETSLRPSAQGLFQPSFASTDRPKPPSTRVGADMTTVASLTNYVSPEQRFVTCINQDNNRKKRT